VDPPAEPVIQPAPAHDREAEVQNLINAGTRQRISDGDRRDDPTYCCPHGELITELIGRVRQLDRDIAELFAEMGATR
jgi:hypothetical protein